MSGCVEATLLAVEHGTTNSNDENVPPAFILIKNAIIVYPAYKATGPVNQQRLCYSSVVCVVAVWRCVHAMLYQANYSIYTAPELVKLMMLCIRDVL